MSKLHRRSVLTGSALSSRVSQWTQRGFIKSMQTVDITIATGATTNTATITSVDPNSCMLVFGGFSSPYSDGAMSGGNMHAARIWSRVALTNATTVTATRNTSDGTYTSSVTATIVEFVPGVIKSVQRGTITSVTTSGTATITAVDTTKSVAATLGQTTTTEFTAAPANGLSWFLWLVRVDLQNSTTVRGRSDTGGDWIVGYQVVEFY